ncbi:hypothetical protein MKX03_005161, partial [Papaver bracteatum]
FLNSGESTYDYSDISGNNDLSDKEPPLAYNLVAKENEKRKKCDRRIKRIKTKRRRMVTVMSDESGGEE